MASRPELKVEDENGFIRFYKSLPAMSEDTLRIFDRGDWYTSHGDDALFVARTIYKSTSVIRQLGRNDESGLPSVTMTTTVFRQFLRQCLFKLGKRVEIWASLNGRMNWTMVKHASAGNLQDVEDELGGQFETAPMILAVKISAKSSEAKNVGVCFADASVRELGVSEFLDNDLYSNFEALLIQLGVRECLVQSDSADGTKDLELAKLKQIIGNCGVVLSEMPVSDFSTKDVEQDLSRVLKDEQSANMLPQTALKLAMGSASALIKYLGILQDPSNLGQYQLYQHELSQYMKLDAAALRALNLVPSSRDGAKTMSLYGVLNHCKTPNGSRLLSQWLKQPLMDKAEIEERQDLVSAFAENTELRQAMQEEHLRLIPDLYRLSKKFQRKKANLEDVVRAYQVVIRLPGFLEALTNVMDERYRPVVDKIYTNKLHGLSQNLGKLQDLVESTVQLDALDRHEYIIKPEFDERLRLIRNKLDALGEDIRSEFKSVADDLGQEPDKKLFLESHRTYGWCMRLTRAEAGCIRNNSCYQECSTQKNGVYFTTKEMQALRREFDQLSQNYNRSQASLVAEVVAVAATYCPVLERLASVLAHLDVIVAFAHAAVNAPTTYVRPRIHSRGQGQTVLKDSRHPCMELQDGVQFITNDVMLTRDRSSFLIITGPNMGGKSTYIRQIGVIALMAQIGSFVPCTNAEVTIFDSILARVGASDSQLKGVSTFMAEMLETANILRSATAESLIIIDELGRGTSTYDGFGLAWAISEHIIKEIRCFGLFATHFHELTALAGEHPSVANIHVTAHISGASNSPQNGRREVTLLYKVEPGVCDRSFGIHVAELVQFPNKVIRMARRRADELEDFTSKHENIEHVADCSDQDMLAGSMLLKDMLTRWKNTIETQNLSHDQIVAKMKEMVMADPRLRENPYFQTIQLS
jgi:DNA mismatch repair protein MSH2